MDVEREGGTGRGRCQHVGRSAARREVTLGDEPHQTTVAQGEIEVVRDDNCRRSRIALRAQHLEHRTRVRRIEARRWLVEENTLRALTDRLREDHAPCLAARQLVESPCCEVLDVGRTHRLARRREIGLGREPESTLLRVPAEQHDLLDDERECKLVLLRQIGELPRDHPAVDARRIVAHAPHCSRRDRDEPCHRTQERRLAGAVRPDDHHELALRDARTHAAHDGASAELDIDIGELEPHLTFLPSRIADGNAVTQGLVRRRTDRVVMNLPVEIIHNGKKVRAVSQDLSPMGMFIRLSPPLEAGTILQVVISPNGQRHVMTGQVTHALGEVEARTLGRYPGVGIMFRDPMRPSEQQFLDAIARMLERHAASRTAADLRILVADSQTRILERLSTALGSAGFIVATATNGIEAIGACLSKTPDVALIERDMPVVDGLHVLQEMGRHSELASVPVMIMSANATDLALHQAFQLGAADFNTKPFTVLEVNLRAPRRARVFQRDIERVVLRGSLTEVGLPTLLQMFEQEKKTGQLSVTRDQIVAWIDFINGKIVRARSSESDGDPRDIVLKVLDWRHGYFELSAGTPNIAKVELEASVTHLLLEHARLRDEADRADDPSADERLL